jgi:uncharacterized protein (TIGR03382 family)
VSAVNAAGLAIASAVAVLLLVALLRPEWF